jgi:DtxR family Mn-dependent transcriptional regulator
MKNKRAPLSAAVEDYLKAIYLLQTTAAGATTTALAGALGVSAASATNMIKKLAARRLARHLPYRGVVLTPAGEKVALEIVRHHRLIELFLSETLGIPWDEVHAEAHRLEHVLSDQLEDHIAAFLGNPTEDPHGDPIPTKAGIVAPDTPRSLADLEPGARATIRRITDQDAAHLRYLQRLGLVPKATVELVDAAPFEGPLRVRVGSREHSLDRQLARHIRVSRRAARQE